jgi:hypothetical protein
MGNVSSVRGVLSAGEKTSAVEILYNYLFQQRKLLRENKPLAPQQTAADLIVSQVNSTLQHYWHGVASGPEPGSELDLAGI